MVLSPMFNELPEIAGRRVRAQAAGMAAAEDKVVVDALWDDLAITRAPSAVVAAEAEALRGQAPGLGRHRLGLAPGGARAALEGKEDVEEAPPSWPPAATVRVMPFLEGIPCSIHGMVYLDGVAVPAGRDGHAAPAGVQPPPPCRRGHVLGPAPADREVMRATWPGGSGRGCASGWATAEPHRGRGAGGRGVPADRAEPSPGRRAVGDDPRRPRVAGRAARPGPGRGRAAGLAGRRAGAPGAGRRRPDRAGGAWTVTTVTASATGTCRWCSPAARAAWLTDGGAARRARSARRGWRVRAAGLDPARVTAGPSVAARRGRVRPGRRALRDRHRPAGAGPPGPVNAATRPEGPGAPEKPCRVR